MPTRSNRKTLVPRSLERRIFFSYFAVFSLLLLAFALVIHLAFVRSLQSQMNARVDLLLSAGIRSVRINGDRIAVRESLLPAALLAQGQGLEWFDARRTRIATEGLVPEDPHLSGARQDFTASHDNRTLRTGTAVIVNPASHKTIGWVRASQDVERTRAEAWRLDDILIAGCLCALAASALGGRYLQVRSVLPIHAAYERLQEFSANASHDLRGPITAVHSNADAALRDPSGMRDADRERFSSIAKAAKHMTRLTDDLLLLARAERSLERELFAVDLNLLVGNVTRLYGAEFEKHAVSLVNRMPQGVTVYGNPDQIERIFSNLIENALRYTPAGGQVEIEGAQHRGSVSVHVRDSGIGIAPEHVEKLFDRFWRADAARTRFSGTGLGLPIARALARRSRSAAKWRKAPSSWSLFPCVRPHEAALMVS